MNCWKLLNREFWYFIGFEKYIYKRKKIRELLEIYPMPFHICMLWKFWFFQLNGVRRENIGILFPNFKLNSFFYFFFLPQIRLFFAINNYLLDIFNYWYFNKSYYLGYGSHSYKIGTMLIVQHDANYSNRINCKEL